MTDFHEYQYHADRTSAFHGDQSPDRLVVAALGLTGEAGEVAELVKKHIGHSHDLPQDRLEEEIGDVLWYVAELCSALGVPLAAIAADNLAKLAERYPAGFDPERSRNRDK